jgi:hypothetical protein
VVRFTSGADIVVKREKCEVLDDKGFGKWGRRENSDGKNSDWHPRIPGVDHESD